MSRSGYSDDLTPWALIRWRGAVSQAIRGKRGQAFLRELRTALDALPARRLIREELVDPAGEVCALGAVGRLRGLDMRDLEPEPETMAATFDIPRALAAEVMFENDDSDCWGAIDRTPERRWQIVSDWVDEHLKATP